MSDPGWELKFAFSSDTANLPPSTPQGEVSDVVPLGLCAEVSPAIASAAFAYGAQLLNVQLCPSF